MNPGRCRFMRERELAEAQAEDMAAAGRSWRRRCRRWVSAR
jgi:hypothetical protein